MSNSEDLRAWQQKRDFAHQLDGVSFVCRKLKIPIHKLRDVIDGLQGAGGGRDEFDLSHLSLARRLRHTGKDETAAAYARRKVAALNDAQHKAGRLLFTITPGGGIEHKRTHYADHLTTVANWMMQRARESELWAKHPGMAIESFVDQAIEMLPAAVSEDEQENDSMAIDADLYIQRMMNQSINCVVKACDRAAEVGRDDKQIVEMAIERFTRYVQDRRNSRAAAIEIEEEGLQICHPPKTDGRVTNLSPSMQISEEKPNMEAAARELARRGYPVFPVNWIKEDGRCSCQTNKGAKCTSPGKHPRISEWQALATTDESWIKSWWQRWPDANPGILTGKKSGVFVLDIDPRHGGDETLRKLVAEHGELPKTLVAATGGGGFHIFYAYPSGVEVRNSSGKLGAGIDVRGEGGYVIGAGSLHASGRRYTWLIEDEPAQSPDWSLSRLTEEKTAAISSSTKPRAEVKNSAGLGAVISEGSRNELLFKIACSMRGKGAGFDEIEAELSDINARRCSPSLPADEVQKIARSAATYSANRVGVVRA
jgi:hypothetical protein